MPRSFKIGISLVAGFFICLFLLGQILRWFWGEDHDRIVFKNEKFEFVAHRDRMGVWFVEAPRSADLSFAVGFLQAHDREYQLEISRLMALGKLSSVFGKSLLGKDRIMRLSSHVAKSTFERLRPELKYNKEYEDSLKAFVDGRNAYFTSEYLLAAPVEYSLFSIKRQDLEPWEPWHILALMRAHTWDLSYDLRDEMLALEMRKIFPSSSVESMFPRESNFGLSHYADPSISAHVELPKGPPREIRDKWIKRFSTNIQLRSEDTTARYQKLKNTIVPGARDDEEAKSLENLDRVFGWGREVDPNKGSNLWVLQDGKNKNQIQMCADNHLGAYWPSPLYPISYVVGKPGDAHFQRGVGFTFPGVPWLVQGRITDAHGSISWGVTIANYGNNIDLVKVNEKDLGPPVSKPVDFIYAFGDPVTGQKSQEVVSETLTPWGPRVDQSLDWKVYQPNSSEPLALDWMGFREILDPGYFFFLRSTHGTKQFEEDAIENWHFPPVNLVYVLNKKDDAHYQVGHHVTGTLFKKLGSGPHRLGPISPAELKFRGSSFAWDRPRFQRKVESGEDLFFLSANQRIWPGELSEKLAYHWGDAARAEVLKTRKNDLLKNPPEGQLYTESLSLLRFYKGLRKSYRAEDLCGPLSPEKFRACNEWLAEIDRWSGSSEVRSWPVTFVSLWRNIMAAMLWKIPVLEMNSETEPRTALPQASSSGGVEGLRDQVFDRWRRQGFFRVFMTQISENPMLANQIAQDFLKKTGSELVRESFATTVKTLTNGLGEDPRFWAWGRVHRMDWRHPVKKIPGRLGNMLSQSLLGPEISLPGTEDSPLVGTYGWLPKEPLKFRTDIGAVLRFCASGSNQGEGDFEWANITGTSGNPFSKWAMLFARETFFKQTLYRFDSPDGQSR